MNVVRDDDGTRYLLLKRSSDSSLVRDPATGAERYVPNDQLDVLDDASALDVAAGGVDDSVRTLLRFVHDDRSLGLLLELCDGGPTGVRTMLGTYDFCESDLHGRLATLVAAGLLEEVEVAGERGYGVTADCERALAILRPD